MSNLNSSYDKYREDLESAEAWCKEMYECRFASYFQDQRSLFKRLKSTQHPITDAELEFLLTEVPIHLFEVSETLNAFRVSLEALKLHIKQEEARLFKASTASSEAKRREEAAAGVLEDKLLTTAYASIIARVENEISFSRELIMGAKKIWDGRRATDRVNPISEVLTDPKDALPEYTAPKSYIK